MSDINVRVYDALMGAGKRALADEFAEINELPSCACAHHSDGSVTTFICPAHAEVDPCLAVAQVTGKRRKGTLKNNVCTNCGWRTRAEDETEQLRAMGIEHIRILNEMDALNPEYLRGQVELIASLTADGDMDAAMEDIYTTLEIAPL